ncbi:hypothetical protein GCM10007920_25580 [Ciceribacter naphthalenivorans]|uniref:Cell division and transport-associated protein TolA n=2 Tax=Alphaproteobacteria TaxID=28211 RepID=A0A512HPC6_9HYPH|nr:hypothetical protein RNA01_42340 [Ciceribacter naphthalenivorans]GLR22770.1 hypothetical protein GCM10007920_25580 [Ciceribacter naphthalenivorans]GLT05626.1 hypothetical protein GCM10007926_25580 [Sphingomonas psychrolutea]
MALVSISAPESFDVADVEALPVDIVPIEELTQIQQGDKTAPVAEKSAPVPTKRPTSVADAQNIGENKIDLKSVPKPSEKPSNAESSAAPEKVEKVQPTQDDVTNDVKDIIKEETVAEKPVEVAKAEPPKPDVAPEPKPAPPAEKAPPEEATAEEIPLPDNVPLPAAKPKPPKPAEAKPAETKPSQSETAKAQDKKKDVKTQETAKSKSAKESDFNADEVAALLNKNDPTAGGAKASPDKAAFGGKKTTGGSKLSQSEMDALRGQIQNNWSVIPGLADASDVRIRVKFQLDESGELIGEPEVTATGGTPQTQQVLMGGARRAVLRSAPFKNLPRDKYDAWSEVIVNFDPSELM